MNTIIRKSALLLIATLFMGQSIAATSCWELVKNYFGSVARSSDNNITTPPVFGEQDTFVGANEQITRALLRQHVSSGEGAFEAVSEKVSSVPATMSKFDMLKSMNFSEITPLLLATFKPYFTPLNLSVAAVGIGVLGFGAYKAYTFYDTLRFLEECEKEFNPDIPSLNGKQVLSKKESNRCSDEEKKREYSDKLVRLFTILNLKDTISDDTILGRILENDTTQATDFINQKTRTINFNNSGNSRKQFIDLLVQFLSSNKSYYGDRRLPALMGTLKNQEKKWFDRFLLKNYKLHAEWLICNYLRSYLAIFPDPQRTESDKK